MRRLLATRGEGLWKTLSEKIQGCLPSPIRLLLLPKSAPLVVELGPHAKTAEVWLETARDRKYRGALDDAGRDADDLLKSRAKDRPLVRLRLDPALVLVRDLSLPLAAAENLRSVLVMEMDRLSPFQASEVYFGYHILAKRPRENVLSVRLAVAQRGPIEHWKQVLEDSGARVETVEVPADGRLFHLHAAHTAAQQEKTRIGAVLLPLTVLALFVGTLVFPTWHAKGVADSLQQENLQLMRKAEAVSDLRTRLQKSVETANSVFAKRNATRLAVAIVDELTKLLPNHTWLEALEVRKTEVRIKGQSRESSKLIGFLEASPMFKNVSFRSPVVQIDTTGRERFEIAMALTQGGGNGGH